MEYMAKFGINCGVSSGYGLKSPDYVERIEQFTAQDPLAAIELVKDYASNFACDYLSDPETNYTTVKLLALLEENEELKLDKEIVVRRSMLEHLLNIP